MKKLFVFLFAVAALLSSCTISEPEAARPKQEGVTLTFTASFESNNPTRTVLDGTHVLWSPKDAIMVWYDGYYAGFQNSLTEPAPTCDFTGTLNLFSEIGAPDGKTEFGAIYPYYMTEDQSEYSYFYDDVFGGLFVLPEQDAVEGSFDKYAFPCVATTLDTHLYFRNICGGVIMRFSSGCEDYAGVVFRANGMEPLAAYEVYATMVDFEDGAGEVPYVFQTEYGSPDVILYAPDDGFKPGVDYYVPMLPCPLRAGFSIAFVRESGENLEVAVKKYTGAQEIKRSVFGRPGALDTGLTWTEYNQTVENPAVIERQWTIEDGDGTKYLFDIGHSIPGYSLLCELDKPSFFADDLHPYELSRSLFGDIQVNLKDYDAFYNITDVNASSLTCRLFNGSATYEDPYPSELVFTPVTSAVTPEYAGLWVDVDGQHYDIYISSSYPDMYDQFLTIADKNRGRLPIVYMNNYGTAEDFSNAKVKGKVAVVNRGEINFSEKVTNAYNAGAIGLLVVNNADGVVYMNVDDAQQIPSGCLLQEVGTKLVGKTFIDCYRPTLAEVLASLSE